MSEFINAIAASDLAPGTGAEISLGGRAVALFNVGGTFHAIGNTCLHRGGPLGQGFVEGPRVTCPWHGWCFDVTTGENVMNPELKVVHYEVKVEDGQVLVNLEPSR
jgi:nitrite reductase/ring-hydroxylating ferredoxin subunit